MDKTLIHSDLDVIVNLFTQINFDSGVCLFCLFLLISHLRLKHTPGSNVIIVVGAPAFLKEPEETAVLCHNARCISQYDGANRLEDLGAGKRISAKT